MGSFARDAYTQGDKVVAAALLCCRVAPIGAGICGCGVFGAGWGYVVGRV